MPISLKKTRLFNLSERKNSDDKLRLFDTVLDRDRQTDRRTDRQQILHLCMGKNDL